MATQTTTRPRRVLAIGGGGLEPAGTELDQHLIELTEREDPRICLLPTGGPGGADQIARFYDVFGGRAEPSHLTLAQVAESPDLLRKHLLAQDAVYVGGGGMVDVLGSWRARGVDGVLRSAWESGVVMAGQSSGSLCWFEAGITAGQGQPRPIRGLGLLPASNSVHWSAAPWRRRTYIDCVADGMPAGWGVDDGAALVFEGTDLAAAVAGVSGARAWRVERVGAEVVETPLVTRVLGAPLAPPEFPPEPVDAAIAELRAVRAVRFHTLGRHGVRRVRHGD
jgi:peptidase E